MPYTNDTGFDIYADSNRQILPVVKPAKKGEPQGVPETAAFMVVRAGQTLDDDQAKAYGLGTNAPAKVSAADASAQAQIDTLKGELDNRDDTIASNEQEIKRLRGELPADHADYLAPEVPATTGSGS